MSFLALAVVFLPQLTTTDKERAKQKYKKEAASGAHLFLDVVRLVLNNNNSKISSLSLLPLWALPSLRLSKFVNL